MPSGEQTPLLGTRIATSTSTSTSRTAVPTSGPDPPAKPLSNEDNLTKFRIAIGINVDETTRADLEAAQKGPRGLYRQIIRTQRNLYLQYVAVESLYYIAILVQMFIGAVLASLGSLPTLHPAAITILGIVNTSTAGIQALLKGQGLPDRLRKNEFEMKKVQDFIEETEIRLAVAGEGTLTADELENLVDQIFEKYNAARDTAEMNNPANYTRQVDPEPTASTDGAADGGQVSGIKALARRPTNLDQNGGDNGQGKGKFVID